MIYRFRGKYQGKRAEIYWDTESGELAGPGDSVDQLEAAASACEMMRQPVGPHTGPHTGTAAESLRSVHSIADLLCRFVLDEPQVDINPPTPLDTVPGAIY